MPLLTTDWRLVANCKLPLASTHSMTVWPSGLRRWLKAPVRKGVGSNPTAVTDVFLFVAQERFFDLILRARAGKVAGLVVLLQLGRGVERLVTVQLLLRSTQQDSLAEWS